ncbi:hypothetical protein FGO68_gene11882 [Halteria grandinella]|uniref:Uncharacterized protein n=1 Tax=Halteria grandinella TaxID=5974 RepID=A0A8J8P0S6_HALGN|nr:hypothetical protein FGO68_gene11882 [Halteria grandinella]
MKNLELIKELGDNIQVISDKVSSFNDQYKIINQRSVKKGTIKPQSQTKIFIPRNDINIDLKFQKSILKQFQTSQNFNRIISSGSYISITESENSSELYKIDDRNHLIYLFSVPFEVRLMQVTDDNRIAINEQLYSLIDLSYRASIPIPIESCISVSQMQNILYYGHINYSWIWRIEKDLKKTKLKPNLGKNKGPGVVQIEGLRGLQDQLLFLYKGVVRKFIVVPDIDIQSSEVACQVQEEILRFQILPDNIHLIAITQNRQLYISDHFTGNVIQRIDNQAAFSTIFVHPHFDLEQFPVILGNSISSVQAFDILNSGIKFENQIDGAQIIAKIDDGKFIIFEGTYLLLIIFH